MVMEDEKMKKKFLLVLGATLLLFTGCKKEELLDFEQIKPMLETLVINENTVFPPLKEVSEEDLKNVYGIDAALTEEIHFMQAEDSTKAQMYIIALPKNGKEKELKKQIDTYFESLQLQADMYNPANADMIKNKEEKQIGNYLVYIVSEYNSDVLKIIKK